MKLKKVQQDRISRKIEFLLKLRTRVLNEETAEDVSSKTYIDLLRIEENIDVLVSSMKIHDKDLLASIEAYDEYVGELFYAKRAEELITLDENM